MACWTAWLSALPTSSWAWLWRSSAPVSSSERNSCWKLWATSWLSGPRCLWARPALLLWSGSSGSSSSSGSLASVCESAFSRDSLISFSACRQKCLTTKCLRTAPNRCSCFSSISLATRLREDHISPHPFRGRRGGGGAVEPAASPVEGVALPGHRGPEDRPLLLAQVLEAGLHQTQLLIPHLQPQNTEHTRTHCVMYSMASTCASWPFKASTCASWSSRAPPSSSCILVASSARCILAASCSSSSAHISSQRRAHGSDRAGPRTAARTRSPSRLDQEGRSFCRSQVCCRCLASSSRCTWGRRARLRLEVGGYYARRWQVWRRPRSPTSASRSGSRRSRAGRRRAPLRSSLWLLSSFFLLDAMRRHRSSSSCFVFLAHSATRCRSFEMKSCELRENVSIMTRLRVYTPDRWTSGL
ncbi:hypothetical protein EYF80_060275 [Liparis tanakae]|uniref:Secreted protein n=1 Tax=Liparis tanakae TaxID=230148 RepID=A0A4Z2EKV0_9TELE|nr:hypothetical protein EYF80_060275 [Liparis tanakae]